MKAAVGELWRAVFCRSRNFVKGQWRELISSRYFLNPATVLGYLIDSGSITMPILYEGMLLPLVLGLVDGTVLSSSPPPPPCSHPLQ